MHFGLVIDGELVMIAHVMETIERELVLSGGRFSATELTDWIARLNQIIEQKKRARSI